LRILESFASEGIAALVIKGPVLAVRAYANPARRSYGDLDLLVRHRDVRRATELMIAGGFAPAIPLSAIDAGKIPGQYLFSKPDSKLIVELHNDRTLRAGLHLATNVLGAQMPRKAQATVKADAAAARLADQVCKWLPAAGWAPPSLFQRALFRMRMRGDFISGTAYLLRLSLSPTEE